MIHKKIKKNIDKRIKKVQEQFKLQVKNDGDLDKKKKFVKNRLPKKLASESDILLETLLNYLMEEAMDKIDKEDLDIQEPFYEMNLREETKKWGRKSDKKPNIREIKFSLDPRVKDGAIAGGTTLAIGSMATAYFSSQLTAVGLITSSISTLAISGLAFRIFYKKAEPKSKALFISDIDSFISNYKLQLVVWLSSVEGKFNKDFNRFCESKNLNYKL